MNPSQMRRMRKRLGMTQSELARALAVNRAAVCQWESGARTPSPMAVKFLTLLLELHKRGIRYGEQ
jgi:DNA-binding transcriptional regulator YiaG